MFYLSNRYTYLILGDPIRVKNSERHGNLTKDFQTLFKELLDQGYFNPSRIHIVCRILEFVLYFSLSAYFACWDGFSRVLSILLFTCGFVRCSFVQHEGGHGSFTGNPKYDRWLHVFYYSESYFKMRKTPIYRHTFWYSSFYSLIPINF